ncbi:hypothetical protein C8R45DRAFT_944859 [Mycena sanguinolenta]|nr:hypothetical protein C8R45DRAFT_944859 [Mycena sanguinolenta]
MDPVGPSDSITLCMNGTARHPPGTFYSSVRTICLAQVLYSSSIVHDTNPDRVGGPRSLAVSRVFSEVTVGCVQGFFAFRIYTFTKKVYIPGLVWFVVFVDIVGRVALFAAVPPMPQSWEPS